MTAEEIIERLLDERKISAKEAIILVKGILGIFKEDLKNKVKKKLDIPINPNPKPWGDIGIVEAYGVRIPPVTVMYGVTTYPSTGWDNGNNVYDASSFTWESSDTTATYSDDNKLKK